jgi:hypothetical protein
MRSFKEYLSDKLSQDQPPSAGDLGDNHSNADRNFGRSGAKSKNVMSGGSKAISDLNPDRLFGKKRCKK